VAIAKKKKSEYNDSKIKDLKDSGINYEKR